MSNLQDDIRRIDSKISEHQRKIDTFEQKEQQIKPRYEKANRTLLDAQDELNSLQVSMRKVQEQIQQAQKDLGKINDERSNLANEKARMVNEVTHQNKEKVRVHEMIEAETRRNALKK